MARPLPSIGILAPNPRWAIYHVLDDLRRFLDREGYVTALYRSATIPEELANYDRVVMHFQDYDGFTSDFFQRELRDKTFVFASGANYEHVPWECVDTVGVQSDLLGDYLSDHLIDRGLPIAEWPRIITTPAGVDTNVFYPPEAETEAGTNMTPREQSEREGVGVAGNLQHRKWFRDTYDRYAVATERDVHLHDGWSEEYLSRPQLRDFYGSLDCYLHLSTFDGGGLGIIEAAACGTPVVSTPVGNAPQVEGVELVGEASVEIGEGEPPSIAEIDAAVERAIDRGPITDEIEEHWSWEAVISAWESGMDL